MNIGIILYSKTNNTLTVAQRLEQALGSLGQTAKIERITAIESSPPQNIVLKDKPDIANYDTLVLASPVHAFSLCPVMRLYLEQLDRLDNKKIYLFVTQQFPYAWIGGNRAISQMNKICQSKGGETVKTGIVNWSNKQREQQMTDLADSFAKAMARD